jgi:DNA replication factor GINS
MDLDELRSVRRTERQKDSLQHLRDSFYEDVAAYIEERKAERRRAADAADDPFGDPEVGQLTDEISTAEDVVEAIYERRVGKVVKLASFAAADMSADKSGLTAEERALFEDLVDRIKQNRRTVLDTLAGEESDASDGESVTAQPDTATRASESSTSAPPSAVTDDPVRATETADVDDSPDAPAGDAEPIESDATVSPDESTTEPPTPDDVLAAAMGGGDSDTTEPSTRADPAAASTGTDPERESVSPAVDTDVGDRERDVAVTDTAETDGGDATIAADTAGSATGGPATPGSTPDDDSRRADDAAAAQTSGTADAGRSDSRPDRVTLRITADVGRIYGVDEREYDLASEDVVTLPATNAGPLVERDAAERLE